VVWRFEGRFVLLCHQPKFFSKNFLEIKNKNNMTTTESSVWASLVAVGGDLAGSIIVFAPVLPILIVALLASVLLLFLQNVLPTKKTPGAGKSSSSKAATQTKPIKKRAAPICPFSAETNFIVETAEHLPPTPLDDYASWMDPDHKDYGKPLAARWLNAGLSGQDTPGILRAGLTRLRNSEHFLVQEPFRIRDELRLKQKALDDPKRFPLVYVEEADSIDAQRETLELFLSYLPQKYPDLYKYDEKANKLHVEPLNETFSIDEWMKTRPLELCERIVQEDLILMRPAKPSEPFESHAMAAAAVVFSFNDLKEKLGQPVGEEYRELLAVVSQVSSALSLTPFFIHTILCQALSTRQSRAFRSISSGRWI
jgi:hypothetical protein